jgi:hypothetical protein
MFVGVLMVGLTMGGGRVQAQDALPGDADGSCKVDGVDFVVVFNNYGKPVSGGVTEGDFDGDGQVSGVDFVILLNNYGAVCPSGTVTPRPTATRTPTPTRGGPTATPLPTLPPGTGTGYNWGAFDPMAVPVEIQAWWTPATGDPVVDNFKGFGHAHVMCRWPTGQSVSGEIRTFCRVMMHNNPSTMTNLVFQWAPGGTHIVTYPVNMKCPFDGINESNCSKEIAVTIPLGGRSGWESLRIRALMDTPDGHRWTTSSELPLNVGTGGSTTYIHCTSVAGGPTCMTGKSWYDSGVDYQNATINGVPTHPVSGTVTFKVAGTQAAPLRLQAFLDRSHFIPATAHWPAEPELNGPLLLDVQNVARNQDFPVTIDTTKLANGWHSFAARATSTASLASSCGSVCNYQVVSPDRQAGIAKIWFYVQN